MCNEDLLGDVHYCTWQDIRKGYYLDIALKLGVGLDQSAGLLANAISKVLCILSNLTEGKGHFTSVVFSICR